MTHPSLQHNSLEKIDANGDEIVINSRISGINASLVY